MTTLTPPQLEVLSILADGDFYEPGEIWQQHSSYNNVSSALGIRNIGRTLDALVRLGMIERFNDDGYVITADGLEATKTKLCIVCKEKPQWPGSVLCASCGNEGS